MKTILLAGGGHTHLSILKQLIASPVPNTRWILLSSHSYQYYSGMFSGYIDSTYSIDDIRIDLKALAKKANCQFCEASIDDIDPHEKTVTAGEHRIAYDFLSLDIGSHTNNQNIPGLAEAQSALKPAHEFPNHIQALRESSNVVIIGGGAAACEMALSLKAWKNQQHRRYDQISLIHSGELLEGNGKKASQLMTNLLKQQSITHYPNERAESVEDHQILTDHSSRIRYEHVIYLGGAEAPDVMKRAGIPTDERGFLLVNGMLQSPDHPAIFGAGDCVSMLSYPELEKNGVHAVRQGPVLWHNLLAALTKQPLKDYTPPAKTLAILSTGNREGLLLYGKQAIYGKLPWHLKHTIDRRFINSYK